MRADANKIGLAAIHRILRGARPFELDVAGTAVRVTVSPGPKEEWPEGGVQGLDLAQDGPWPQAVNLDCAWEGGSCPLQMQCRYWRGSGRYRHFVGIWIHFRDRRGSLVWITLPTAIADAEDGRTVKLPAAISTFKRKRDAHRALVERLGPAMREVVHESGVPLISNSTADVCEIAIPTAEILPSPEAAFRRLVQVALLKLDFVDRGRYAAMRGKPLVDLARFGIDLAQLRAVAEDENDATDEEDEEADEEPSSPQRERRYWAGGFGEQARLQQFLASNFWQIGWSKDDSKKPARLTWKRFSQIQPGDYFAIKGFGGTNDLVIHMVGRVTGVDAEKGRLDLERLDVPRYSDKAPSGRGAGSWFDTLVPVRRPDVIEKLFGVGEQADAPSAPPPPVELPLNLILYGPPGTGKTYAVRQEIAPRFVTARPASGVPAMTEIANGLKWYEAIAVAMQDLGGSAKVDALLEHPLLKAKYAAQGIPTPLRQMVWGTLGHHTVETSITVKMKRRLGELLFDKRTDGTWHLPDGLSEDLVEVADQLSHKTERSMGTDESFVFLTFHQAYGYEDFIEGIRPRLEISEEEEAQLGYELQDGVFLQAVRAAVRLTGFDGTLEEFCNLPRAERARLLDGAPRFAVFIDEINRGNVARIFGELITLLEPDKRLGGEHEMIVRLPYSRARFGVPSNLHVIGTMNTADRSVEALDAALRRRFEFWELTPKPELLDFPIEGDIAPAALLRTINRRLEKLRDRDHAIGHAYLLELEDDPTIDALKHVFRTKLLPLLQEYFFEDLGKIGLVLGRDFVRRRDPAAVALADCDHEDRDVLAERVTWELVDTEELTDQSFRRIYEHVDAG
jgi:dynein-related subfamily AAA family protein